jgi:hypothetical protein
VKPSLILTFLFIACNSSFGASTEASIECKGTSLKNNSPIAFLQWLKNNGNKTDTIEEMLCCMPEKYRNNYIVAHSSLSAQKSGYVQPRIIFGNILKDGIMFSVSGGDPQYEQHQSVEVMINNTKTNKLEFFDVEFTNQKKISTGPNPQKCMACHGGADPQNSGGPRPIFDPKPWPRMVSTEVDFLGADCPQRNIFRKKAREVTFKAITENNRFRCLRPPNHSNEVNMGIDLAIERFNARRVKNEILKLSNSRQLLTMLAAIDFGCFGYFDHKYQELKYVTEIEDWIHPEENHKHAINNRYLDERIPDEKIILKIMDSLNSKKSKLLAQEVLFESIIEKMNIGSLAQLPSESGFLNCSMNETHFERDLKDLSNFISTFPFSARRYIYDTVDTSVQNGAEFGRYTFEENIKMGLARWVFESRGIDAASWGMKVTRGYDRKFLDYLHTQPIFKRYSKVPKPGQHTASKSELETNMIQSARMCEDLKKHYLKQ